MHLAPIILLFSFIFSPGHSVHVSTLNPAFAFKWKENRNIYAPTVVCLPECVDFNCVYDCGWMTSAGTIVGFRRSSTWQKKLDRLKSYGSNKAITGLINNRNAFTPDRWKQNPKFNSKFLDPFLRYFKKNKTAAASLKNAFKELVMAFNRPKKLKSVGQKSKQKRINQWTVKSRNKLYPEELPPPWLLKIVKNKIPGVIAAQLEKEHEKSISKSGRKSKLGNSLAKLIQLFNQRLKTHSAKFPGKLKPVGAKYGNRQAMKPRQLKSKLRVVGGKDKTSSLSVGHLKNQMGSHHSFYKLPRLPRPLEFVKDSGMVKISPTLKALLGRK